MWVHWVQIQADHHYHFHPAPDFDETAAWRVVHRAVKSNSADAFPVVGRPQLGMAYVVKDGEIEIAVVWRAKNCCYCSDYLARGWSAPKHL